MKRTIKITEAQMKRVIDSIINEGDVSMDEVETKNVEQTKMTSGEWDQFMKKGGAVSGMVHQDDSGNVTITKENEELSDEDIFEEEKEITSWDDVPMMEMSKPSAGLSKEKKSEIAKKARKGGDIGKKGKGFKDVVAKAEKYGADDPEAVAAAAMWKNIKR